MPKPPQQRGAEKYAAGVVSFDRLHFDADNPRLPVSVDGHDESAVMEWMLEDTSLLDLIGAIAAEGYFPGEPVLVAPKPEGKSSTAALDDPKHEFTVVEGNRRLAAVRLLNDPTRAPSRRRAIQSIAKTSRSGAPPTEIPVIAFARRGDILDHLGFRHVTGIKAWEPLAKANYVYQLVSRASERGESLSLEEIARMIGSKGWYVGRLLTTLAVVDRLKKDRAHFRSLGVAEEDLPFSLMLVALGRPSIVEFLGLTSANSPDLRGLNPAALKRLSTWLFKKRADGRTALGESRNMTLLAEVVTSDDAMAALDRGESLRIAAVMALDATEILDVAVGEAHDNVDLALRQTKRLSRVGARAANRVSSLATKARTLDGHVQKMVQGE
jgi:hypothetical protein